MAKSLNSKGKKKFCPYCEQERSVRYFTIKPDVCNTCYAFDRSANFALNPTKVPYLVPNASQATESMNHQ